jgi:hypothetical protein
MSGKQQIQFYFYLRNTGRLSISLMVKNATAGNELAISFAEKVFNLKVPASKDFNKIPAGVTEIKKTGFYALIISSKTIKGKNIADIQSLVLEGPAAANIQFNTKPRRNAASVHLKFPLADSMKAIYFYNEITVLPGSDLLHSYYMACGFSRGYFGIQVNSPTERRVIFSVWDAGNEAVNRSKVLEVNKVKLMAKGEDVFADGFGNEGTGGHSHWLYNWKAGETYRFLLSAVTDSANSTTYYAGYFYIPETQKWKLIACFKAPKDGKPLRSLYSFSENFVGTNGQMLRKSYFGNQWIRRENGDWKALTESSFSYDATAKAGDRIDFGGGTEDNKFYLWHGGFKEANAAFGDKFTRKGGEKIPAIDLYKNEDSAVEAEKETLSIKKYISEDPDTLWKEKNGIYFKIMREGNGDSVTLNETIKVHYKGQLLNGYVFDQTKEAPATFPLNRLIKGWQIGLPYCRKGGKIKLIIPSSLAYSIRNKGEIAPNSVLLFEIEVVGI